MRALVPLLLLVVPMVVPPALGELASPSHQQCCVLPFQVGEGVPRELGCEAFARMWAFMESKQWQPLSSGRVAAIGWTLRQEASLDPEVVVSLRERFDVPLVVAGWIGPSESAGYVATTVSSSGGGSAATGASPREAIDALFAQIGEGSGTDRQTTAYAPSPDLTAAGLALDDAIEASLAGNMPAAEEGVSRVIYHLGRQPGGMPYGPSVELLRSALIVRPRHTGAAMLLGILHLAQERYADAVGAFRWVRELSPRLAGVDRLIQTIEKGKTPLTPSLVMAQAMDVFSPILAPLVARYDPWSPTAAPPGLIALWDPAKGGPELPEVLSGDPSLTLVPTGGQGVELLTDRVRVTGDGVALCTPLPATTVISAVRATDELTIEALLRPADQTQGGPARIVTLSANPSERNFTLGQEESQYVLRLRTSEGDHQGNPQVDAPPGTVRTELQHVVACFADGLVTFYLDGIEVHREQRPGDFSTWSPNYPIALANELTLDRQWHGDIRLVALYSRALSAEEVRARARSLMAAAGGATW